MAVLIKICVTYTGYNLCRRSYKINKGISFDGAYN